MRGYYTTAVNPRLSGAFALNFDAAGFRPGQGVEPTTESPQERWWPDLPWRSAAEAPIVADHAD